MRFYMHYYRKQCLRSRILNLKPWTQNPKQSVSPKPHIDSEKQSLNSLGGGWVKKGISTLEAFCGLGFGVYGYRRGSKTGGPLSSA